MFYPATSLQRGGRFYLCWIADSWPCRLTTITARELWSQDIRVLCDDLSELVLRESRNPHNRFSLRLSCQLVRGLTRLYQKKVSTFLNELCMVNATIMRHTNAKYMDAKPRRRKVPSPRKPTYQHPEQEEEVEERIKNSSNAVARLEDITMREETIPPIVITAEGFGEESGAVEAMLGTTETSGLQVSALAVGAREGSVAPEPQTAGAHLEPLRDITITNIDQSAMHDDTIFRRELERGTLGKKTEIPQIPDILPEPPAPIATTDEVPQMQIQPLAVALPEDEQLLEIELEELEDQPRERRKKKLIVDRVIMFSGHLMRTRVNNPRVELRCDRASYDMVDVMRVPEEMLLQRIAHAGPRLRRVRPLAYALADLYVRNLDAGPRRAPPTPPALQVQTEVVLEGNRSPQVEPMVIEDISTRPAEVDISNLPTDVLNMPDQRDFDRIVPFDESVQERTPEKRAHCDEDSGIPAKQVKSGSRSIRLTLQKSPTHMSTEHYTVEVSAKGASVGEGKRGASVCGEAGEGGKRPRITRARSGSDEPQLGSPDRTKVDLGEPEPITEAQEILNAEWGTQGTIEKLYQAIYRYNKHVTMQLLIQDARPIEASKKSIAVKCFTSLLKLKHNRLIELEKDAVTLKITNITLGKKVTEYYRNELAE